MWSETGAAFLAEKGRTAAKCLKTLGVGDLFSIGFGSVSDMAR
jgi:hypothetical protein